MKMMFCLDPKFTYSDGIMRMEYVGKRANASTKQVFKNKINMDIARMRTRFTMLSWRDCRISTSYKRDEVLSRLSDQQKWIKFFPLQQSLKKGFAPIPKYSLTVISTLSPLQRPPVFWLQALVHGLTYNTETGNYFGSGRAGPITDSNTEIDAGYPADQRPD